MAVDLAIANITLGTASVSRQGFGTILFAGKHNYFSERVRTYTGTASMVADGIPTDSNVYRAALGAFSQSISPSILKIGRQETTSEFTPSDLSTGAVVSLDLNVNDETETTFSYTVIAADDEEAVVDALMTAIAANAGISGHITVTKDGSGNTAKLVIRQTVSDSDWFTAKNILNLTETYVATSTESAADTLEAIVAEDNDFYYYTAEDKSPTFIADTAAAIEAKMKYYRVSAYEAADLLATPAGSLASLVTNNYFRTNGIFHHEAESKFPEVAILAEIAFAPTGSVTYANRQVLSVSPSEGMVSGRALSTTQTGNLSKINATYIARVGSALDDPIITVGGASAGGEYIDNIVGRDNLQVDIEADFTNLLINQKASKVAFNNAGANQVRGVLQGVLNQYTPKGIHNFIEKDFTITIPDQSEFIAADKADRTFRQITFKATLTNAIHMLVVSGSLSY